MRLPRPGDGVFDLGQTSESALSISLLGLI